MKRNKILVNNLDTFITLYHRKRPANIEMVFEFIGKDGSRGFIKGQIYHLDIKFVRRCVTMVMFNLPRLEKNHMDIVINDVLDNSHNCVYSSLNAFTKNWKALK